MGIINKFLHFLIPDNYFKPNDSGDNDQTISVCPKCLLPDLQYVKEFTSGWATPPQRYCPHCGYSGILTLEISLNEYNSVPSADRIEWLREVRLKAFVDANDEYTGYELDGENDVK